MGADYIHVMFTFGTDRLNTQLTFGGASYKADHDGISTGKEAYFFKGNYGFKSDAYDFGGSQYGYFENSKNAPGYIDNDPPNIIDIGIFEVGGEYNYGFGDLFHDMIEGTRNYFNSLILISNPGGND